MGPDTRRRKMGLALDGLFAPMTTPTTDGRGRGIEWGRKWPFRVTEEERRQGRRRKEMDMISPLFRSSAFLGVCRFRPPSGTCLDSPLLCPMDKSADPMIASPLVRSPFPPPHEYSGLPDPCSSAGSVAFAPRFLLAVISLSASDRSNAASEATEEVKKKVEA